MTSTTMTTAAIMAALLDPVPVLDSFLPLAPAAAEVGVCTTEMTVLANTQYYSYTVSLRGDVGKETQECLSSLL